MKVLMVEQNPDDAELLSAELRSCGEKVLYQCVDNAADMRESLGQDWDIVIADDATPKFGSLEALQILKQSCKDIPFIIYSGDMSERAAAAAMHDGVQDYVRKGHVARLAPVVKRELRNAAARRARAQAEFMLHQLSCYDAVTGLANRKLFCEQVGGLLPGVAAARGIGAIYVVKVDRFARINHAAGYAEGDRMLQQAGERLRRCATGGELVARLAGERFALFSRHLASRSDAKAYARYVMESFREPFRSGNMEFYLSVSVGIALFPDDGMEASTLLVNAESAASHARHRSASKYSCYANDIAQRACRHVVLEAALRRAVERDELVLHYQPIVRLSDEQIIGMEALIRWNHPEHGLLYPDQFIPVADESGIIVDIGEWVLREACRQMKALHQRGFPSLLLSVNVSAVQFLQPLLPQQVDAALEASGIDPGRVELEITETVLMQEVDATSLTLHAMKERGLSISVDDFGTGYSSLNYLKRFPIDILKIDRTFTRDIVCSEHDYAIVRAIAALAHSLELCVVAEGVESEEQLAMLRRERCDRGQGFFFSKPLALPELTAFLACEARQACAGVQHATHAVGRTA